MGISGSASDSSPEDSLINELDTIDLHHGTYSTDPSFTVLEVIGAVMSERIKNGLSEFGFHEFQTTADRFRAVRPPPSAPAPPIVGVTSRFHSLSPPEGVLSVNACFQQSGKLAARRRSGMLCYRLFKSGERNDPISQCFRL